MANNQKNTNAADTQAVAKATSQRPSDLVAVRNFLGMCLSKWPWFLLSVVICLGLAKYYLLKTTPVYTRAASILIKESGKERTSFADQLNYMGDMGIGTGASNINNEIKYIQSYKMISEAVKRKHFNIDYQTEGKYRMTTLYGSTLPVEVEFTDSADTKTGTFTINLNKDINKLMLTNFNVGGPSTVGNDIMTVFEQEVITPLGRLIVHRSPAYDKAAQPGLNIIVYKTSIETGTRACMGRLSASLNDNLSTVIDLLYRDVNIQRAEDFLNTLVEVYNETWVDDKNQVAVSTSQFINERLKLISSELEDIHMHIESALIAKLGDTTSRHTTRQFFCGVFVPCSIASQPYISSFAMKICNSPERG